MKKFRVYLEDGRIIKIDAHTPEQAATTARKANPGIIIKKVKLCRDDA